MEQKGRRKKGASDLLKATARMMYIEGKTQEMIGEAVGVSQQTVSQWIKEERWDMARKEVMQIPYFSIMVLVETYKAAAQLMTDKPKEGEKELHILDKLVAVDKALSIIEKIGKKTDIQHLTAYSNGLLSFVQKNDKQVSDFLIGNPDLTLSQLFAQLLPEFVNQYIGQ